MDKFPSSILIVTSFSNIVTSFISDHSSSYFTSLKVITSNWTVVTINLFHCIYPPNTKIDASFISLHPSRDHHISALCLYFIILSKIHINYVTKTYPSLFQCSCPPPTHHFEMTFLTEKIYALLNALQDMHVDC